MLIQSCFTIHFRHPDGKEIVPNSTGTTGPALPSPGLVHKSHSAWFVGSLGFRLITPEQSVEVLSTTVTYLIAAAFWSVSYLLKTAC